MRSEDLRTYGKEVLARDPDRRAAYEVLDLMAYLIACDFIGAEAKVETIQYKFKGTRDEAYVFAATNLAMAHINFAYGRFDELEKAISGFLGNSKVNQIEEGEFLDVLRLRAQKEMILDEFENLESTYAEMLKYKAEDQSENSLYLINSVKAMVLMTHGEFIKAAEVSKKNIAISKQNKYTGLMAPLDSFYVLARSNLAGAHNEEALANFDKIKILAEEYSQWPWYFMSDGYLSREFAINNQIAEALEIVRNEREKLAELGFRHNLGFIPDVNELYCRHMITDIERIETLISRVPNLIMVQQIRALADEWRGKNLLSWIENLPDRTAREKIYKKVALSEFYKDKESIAVEYMSEALSIAESTGQVEFILRQYRLFDVILKAISKKPTVFLEYLSGRITERIELNEKKNRKSLPIPLTTRELEIMKHLATGKTISSISGSLHVSMNTMKTHLRNIYKKLEVDGREKAVEKGRELFLI